MNNKRGSKSLIGDINFGMNNAGTGSGGLGGMMGFMGLPFMSRQAAGKGSGGPWMTVDPRNRSMMQGWDFQAVGGGGGMGGGHGGGSAPGGGTAPGGPNVPSSAPPDATASQQAMNWTFPQYTQTWAFTPPEASPYIPPQPFDPDKYGNPLKRKDVKNNR